MQECRRMRAWHEGHVRRLQQPHLQASAGRLRGGVDLVSHWQRTVCTLQTTRRVRPRDGFELRSGKRPCVQGTAGAVRGWIDVFSIGNCAVR